MSLKSNSFVALAEQVCLHPVLEHRQRRGRQSVSQLPFPVLSFILSPFSCLLTPCKSSWGIWGGSAVNSTARWAEAATAELFSVLFGAETVRFFTFVLTNVSLDKLCHKWACQLAITVNTNNKRISIAPQGRYFRVTGARQCATEKREERQPGRRRTSLART